MQWLKSFSNIAKSNQEQESGQGHVAKFLQNINLANLVNIGTTVEQNLNKTGSIITTVN